ncbi:hypothetical protein BpHYR1_017964 [Brachionus plicatilis]|uniref:Uncharacterized protein n=1 Tax=Brachionus plicatilis TaxID=10195 RepID=A0A3M7R773_BRAPC|nr:hypothetical protein BpHYR1_017964 [Brachionus plicatilis]
MVGSFNCSTQGIDPALYKWICCSCHKGISHLAVSEITEEIQNNPIPLVLEETFQIPQSTSKPVSLDFADIDDERCKILTGISRDDFWIRTR